MTDKEKELYNDFESRFLPGDFVQSRLRMTLSSEERKLSSEEIFEIAGISHSYERSIGGESPQIYVLLKATWGDGWIFHISLENFLEKNDNDPVQKYAFKRINPYDYKNKK